MNFRDLPDYVTLADLEPFGISLDDILNLPRQPASYIALDGALCWSLAELSELLGWMEEGDEP